MYIVLHIMPCFYLLRYAFRVRSTYAVLSVLIILDTFASDLHYILLHKSV